MRVREATQEEVPAILNVLDGAALETDHDSVRQAVGRDQALVAVVDHGTSVTVVGALVLDDDHVDAVAVRRRRRGQGIGTALVDAAADRRERLTASFDANVRPFYDKLGFEIEEVDAHGRNRGVLESA